MAKEVALMSYTGIPADALLSVRAGNVRRQAAINTNKPYKFPKIGIEESPIKIDILQPIGTAYLVMKPGEERYQAIFQGKLAEGMSCEFEIRSASQADDAEEREREAKENANSAAQAKDYLEQHAILSFVQAVLQTVIKERPKDPYKHMARHFMSGYQPTADRTPTSSRRMGGFEFVTPEKEPPAEKEEAKMVADEIITGKRYGGGSPAGRPSTPLAADAAKQSRPPTPPEAADAAATANQLAASPEEEPPSGPPGMLAADAASEVEEAVAAEPAGVPDAAPAQAAGTAGDAEVGKAAPAPTDAELVPAAGGGTQDAEPVANAAAAKAEAQPSGEETPAAE